MPSVRLLSLVCNTTEDSTGPDEAYIRVKGTRVWGPNSMNDGDSADLSGVEAIPFTDSARIELYDQDTGWLDDDDHLGTTYAYANQAGQGEKEHTFDGDDANYRLTYETLP